MEILLKGLMIGIIFGVPVGAIGAMTVQRTLTSGKKLGFLTGLGSSVADCLYACVGAFGLTFISDFLLKHQVIINIIGGIIILSLGIKMFLKTSENNTIESKEKNISITKIFLSSFVIGITNPTVILTFLFAFSYFEIADKMNILNGIELVLGVFIGTLLWWSVLVALTSKLKNKFAKNGLKNMNKVFGIILIIFSLIIFIKLI